MSTSVGEAGKPELVPAAIVAEDGASESEDDVPEASGSKKKKKKKPKKKKKVDYAENGGGVPPRIPAIVEDEAEKARWATELKKGARTSVLEPWSLMVERERPKLNLFRTPACAAVALRTPRLILRQVELGDTTGIRRIKMEPVVQRTQLYGTPSASDIKDSFQRRYVASSVPALDRDGAWRDEYVFAITAKDPASIKLASAGSLRIANRLAVAEGYLGNFALSLEAAPNATLHPAKGEVYKHPTLEETAAAQLVGKMFYELHPQLWGQGIVSEAFAEVLRFAFEEVGCTAVSADPTVGNDASIKLCTKFGLSFVRETSENAFNKPQLFHSISRAEWFTRYRGGAVKDVLGGVETCRWCCDARREVGIVCGCGWAKYCSRECQRADWVWKGGHQSECDA